MRRIGVMVALLLGLHLSTAARAGGRTVLPTMWLDQLRVSCEHLDGYRWAMPDPARWPLQPMPAADTPRMLLFSSLPPTYLADNARQVASWGFKGFILHVGSWNADVWAVDGDPATRGAEDKFLQQVRECNRRCAAVGIDSNVLKISFDHHLPDWFDDAAWAEITERWRQLAICARDSGCVGVAQDWEYIADQYSLNYPGYDFTRYTPEQLRRKVRERMRTAMAAMLDEFPTMVFFTLPENVIIFSNSLSDDMHQGALEAMAERHAPGGMHLMVEFTYLERDPVWLIAYALRMRQLMERALSAAAREYWRSHCTIAEGGWPLGAYPTPDQLPALACGVKSANYSAAQFRAQVAAMRMACPRYTWVYAPGSAWWQYAPDEVARYGGAEGDSAPTVPDIDAYRRAIAEPRAIANPALQRLAARIRSRPLCDARKTLGLIVEWWIIGPFDNRDKKGLRVTYPPEEKIALGASHPGLGGAVRWTRHRVTDPLGVVNLGALLGEVPAVGYAMCYVHAERTVSAQLRLASNDESMVWLGGKSVWVRDRTSRVRNIDADIVPITIPKGTSPLLVKVCNRGRAWEFCVRLTDHWGLPLKGVRCTADRKQEVGSRE